VTACNKLYLTYRSEYLVLRDLCVGVRDRKSGVWQPLHAAACAHVLGPLRSLEGNPGVAQPPRVGERLCLLASSRRVVSGPIVAVELPTAELLREAEQQWQSTFAPRDPRHSSLMLSK
jgi:hypothetical protein